MKSTMSAFFACRDDTIRHLEARAAAVTECLTDVKASHSSLLEQLEVRGIRTTLCLRHANSSAPSLFECCS